MKILLVEIPHPALRATLAAMRSYAALGGREKKALRRSHFTILLAK